MTFQDITIKGGNQQFANTIINTGGQKSKDMTIQNLIAQGKTEQAIKILVENEVEGALTLSARWYQLKREKLQGVIHESDAKLEHNQINNSVLYYAKESEKPINIPTSTSTVCFSDVMQLNEAILQKIIKDNRRRRNHIAVKAEELMTAFRTHKDAKAANPSHDPSGRRIKALQASFKELMDSLSETKKDEIEVVVKRVNNLLSAPIPSYDNLNEAYNLVCGRGYTDSYVMQQLQARPNDTEVRITIAEKIEGFLGGLTITK